MEAMRKIGANTREDTFVERGVGGTGEVTTREGAISRKAELMADPAWGTKYLKGDPSAVREMTRLNTMIDGEASMTDTPTKKNAKKLPALTVTDCCVAEACSADGCVISGSNYCAHPRKGGLQGRDMHDAAGHRTLKKAQNAGARRRGQAVFLTPNSLVR
jgi:hypothetical protein